MKLSAIKKLYFGYLFASMLFGALGMRLYLAHKIDIAQFLGGFLFCSVFVTIVTMPISLSWWRQIDEASREAHKTAWLWGGGLGLLLVALIAALNLIFGGSFMNLMSVALKATNLKEYGFEIGVIASITFMGFGYIINWAMWWKQKGA